MSKLRKCFLSQPARGYPKWRGIKLVSVDVGVRHDDFLHDGYRYVTIGELRIARLLDKQGISFTPDVQVTMRKFDASSNGGRSRKTVIYVPDFIFNRDTYIWTDQDGDEFEIHGIEAKASPGAPPKVQLLFERRNIRILVLGDKEINAFARNGRLPLKLLRRAGRRG